MPALPVEPGFAPRDVNAVFQSRGIVRADFAANAVFERRDDFAARGIIFRVGRKNQQQVERQTHRDNL